MTTSEPDLLHPVWGALRQYLDRMRRPIQDAIRQYPPPIPACDAHFNHLLDQRSALSRELVRLDTMSRGAGGHSVGAIEHFIRSSPCVDAETKRALLGRLHPDH
jgi:hypothetical protein